MNISIKEVLPAIGGLDKSKADAESLTPGQINSLERWAGVPFTDVKALLSKEYNKKMLSEPVEKQQTAKIVFHRMSPDDRPQIKFSLKDTVYGQVIIASTTVGVCFLVFYTGDAERAKSIVERHFSGAEVIAGADKFQEDALAFVEGDDTREVHLHVKGSEENLRIWEELTKVPEGVLTSYGALGKTTQCIAQEVGFAMGDNRIALLIPCHRVIKSTGEIGQYHYGARLKRAIILHEARRQSKKN